MVELDNTSVGFPVHFSNGYRGLPLMGFTMQGWQTTFLGMRELPRDISDFEMKAFFTFDGAEREEINARRGNFADLPARGRRRPRYGVASGPSG